MLIIDRVFWFLESAAYALIVALIVLMLIRLIVDGADLNPFGSTYRTVRRLSDVFVIPVRGLLREFHADPKYAPIIVIVLIILLGLLLLNLLGTLSHMVQGIVWALSRGSIRALLGFIFHGLISIYILMIFVRIVFSMAMVSYMNPVMRFLVNTTDPLLVPLRRRIPPVGRWDISPIVAFIILWLLQAAISATLLRGVRFT
ncbi:MAG TPA: YggT family protein [Pyrinomonadaceae bacterium]|nr:YggT family protein [Pyrinomonadaceae bacterium]